jgi:protein gp37
MSKETNIPWCDSTVNFWSGCTKVSTGCAHCYAETRDKRHMIEKVDHWGKGAPRLKHVGAVRSALAMNAKPWICDTCGEAYPATMQEGKFENCMHGHNSSLHRRRVFSLSLGDWLDKEVPIEWFVEMLDTIRLCDQVIWILCTKRPENCLDRLCEAMVFADKEWMSNLGKIIFPRSPLGEWIGGWIEAFAPHRGMAVVPKNIWLLTSVENQSEADKRVPELLKIPAACRGLSMEPLLGPVQLDPNWLAPDFINDFYGADQDNNGIHWLILGGESGAGARACHVDWIRSLLQFGLSSGTAIFVKQLGDYPVIENNDPISWPTSTVIKKYGEKLTAYLKSKGGDQSEWPEDLRVRQFPST